MGIIKTQLSSVHGLQGQTPAKREGALKSSTLHNQYSLNGTPSMVSLAPPSNLDLDGQKPNIPGKVPYLQNLPE